ncbi:MAG: MBL fold metallo-hydrolase [Kiritimatiellaeota bacterium]|nr:MBL fold metallo-hydrolase [Kiritimatiellota bacterium]
MGMTLDGDVNLDGRVGITILGSGSRGNAVLVGTVESALLIDAGFSRKEILARLATAGLDPCVVKALLITHDHGDHVSGARVLADHLDIPTYLNAATLKHLGKRNLVGAKTTVFDSGSTFSLHPFEVRPFSVPHDALEPVGFLISHTRSDGMTVKIGIATDLGHVSMLVSARLADCDALVLECNHDVKLLRTSDRSLNLKRRIGGRFGHLNNVDAVEALAGLVGAKTRHVCLCHLSGDCNDRGIVEELASAKLAEIGRSDITLSIAEQNAPLETIWL